MKAAAVTKGTPFMSTAAGPPESGSGKVCKGREASNFHQGHKQQQQDLTTEELYIYLLTAPSLGFFTIFCYCI
jgi:hypothetical protein